MARVFICKWYKIVYRREEAGRREVIAAKERWTNQNSNNLGRKEVTIDTLPYIDIDYREKYNKDASQVNIEGQNSTFLKLKMHCFGIYFFKTFVAAIIQAFFTTACKY